MSQRTILTLAFGSVCSLYLAAVASGQALAVPIPQQSDALLQNLTTPSDAATKGMWSAKYAWPLIAMHSAVTPDGRLVTFGSPVGVDTISALKFDVWNPKRGFLAVGHRLLDNSPSVDSFCSAANLLKSGQLLTSGGNAGALDSPPNPTGNNGTSLLNPVRNSVVTGSTMASSRYYSTQTVLSDGRVLITAGTYAGGPATWSYQSPGSHVFEMSGTPEVYTPGVGWSSLFGAASLSPTGVTPDAFGPQDNRWAWVVR